MSYSIRFFSFFILFTFLSPLFSQPIQNNSSTSLEFAVSDTLAFVDDTPVDTNAVTDEILETGKDESMIYIYFNWMPGFGRYENFDILSVHYRHQGSIAPDTLLLGDYVHPAQYKIYSNYGWRRRRMHYGVDLSYPYGTPVVAAFDGIVRISKNNAGGYGNLIVLRHNNGLETYYGHLSKRLVNPGQAIHAGDTIGLGGSTGRSTGNHLHFETRYMGVAFNPNKIIDFDNFKLKVDTLYTHGKEVKLNVADKVPSQEEAEHKYHRVRKGECLSVIARKYRTSISSIKRLNRLRSDFLREGQRLRVR